MDDLADTEITLVTNGGSVKARWLHALRVSDRADEPDSNLL
jgi:hypothetical protein